MIYEKWMIYVRCYNSFGGITDNLPTNLFCWDFTSNFDLISLELSKIST